MGQAEMQLYDITEFTGEAIDSKRYSLRRILNTLNKVKKPKNETDAPKPNVEDIMNEINNGTINMDDLIKGMNGTFNNVANITTESENGEVKKKEVSEEKKEE